MLTRSARLAADTVAVAAVMFRALTLPADCTRPTAPVRLRSGATVDVVATDDGVAAWPHGPRHEDETVTVTAADQVLDAALVMAFLATVTHAAALADTTRAAAHPRTVYVPDAEEREPLDDDADAYALAHALQGLMASRCPWPLTVPLSLGAVDVAALGEGAAYLRPRGQDTPGEIVSCSRSDRFDDLLNIARVYMWDAYRAAVADLMRAVADPCRPR